MKKRLFEWHFSLLYISIKCGLHVLVCVYNQCDYSCDQALMEIEFRRRDRNHLGWIKRTSLSVLGKTLLKEELKTER